ncbi:hypothetical protein LTR38_011790 [Friedmanniomyces endolithicus]|nr:hypothetical protein LTR38_011790 [Friedmanniomyces endolithicus]
MASVPRNGHDTAEPNGYTNNYNDTRQGELSSIPTATPTEVQPNGNTTGKTEAEASSGTGRDGSKAKGSFPAKVKRIWLAKTGIDKRTYMQMFKGALAPTIAISAYQSTAWADTYTTIGYLCGIIAILSLPIQPRAKYLQTMLTNVLVVCFGCAVALLAMYCTVHARLNSEFQQTRNGGPGTSGLAAGGAPTTTYNSSASAVAGVWLFVQIYAISTYRANRPQFTIPSIMYAIFANVSMVYAPQFGSMVQAEAFAKKLLGAFLTGFAISTGVSLFVFPLTSRGVVFNDIAGYINSLRGCMQANLDYLHSLEDSDMFAPHRVNTAGDDVVGSKEAAVFKAKVQALTGLHAKLNMDLPFAKREVAFGSLGPDDIQELARGLRQIMVPTVGLSSMPEIFQRIAESRGWDRELDLSQATVNDAPDDEEKIRVETIQQWHHLMKKLREPYGRATTTIDEGLAHIAIRLRLTPKQSVRSAENAAESNGDEPQPGETGFAAYYARRSADVVQSRKDLFRSWCSVHGIELPASFFEDSSHEDYHMPEAPVWMNADPRSPTQQRLRRQLFVCLHLHFLLRNTNRKVYELILHVDGLQASGKLGKTRLIVPGVKGLRKWAMSLFATDDEGHDDQQIDTGTNGTTVYLGEAYGKRRDPEHLPPQTAWEKSSNMLRMISHVLASPESAFGFRCACATMSVAIVAYLQHTQTFFTRERLFWSQIMISISMSRAKRSWLYIPDIWDLRGYAAIVGCILHRAQDWDRGGYVQRTSVLSYLRTRADKACYSLRRSLLGLDLDNLPDPITEHSMMRGNLGRSLYLLANHYSVMHETVRARLKGCEGNWASKGSPAYQLDKSRHKIFLKANATLGALRAQSAFISFDIPIGGKFPRQQYQEIIALMQSSLNFMNLVSLASVTFTELQEQEAKDEHNSRWLRDFRSLISQAHVTSESITTLLSLLSASVTSGTPLPPYLRVPEPFQLAQRLDEMDQDILSVRHIAEPGYASFAVIQIGTRCVIDDLRLILQLVKELVGELDFSYHIVSTTDPTRNNSSETLLYHAASTEEKKD